MSKEKTSIEVTIRPAEKADLLKVFELANDPVVRANSFYSDKISLNEHRNWYVTKLNDPNFLLLIFENKGRFVGQVKFDMEDEIIIGVSLTPEFRGMRLSPMLLKKGLKFLKSYRPQVTDVIACIKKDNIPSVKAFKRSGFAFEKEVNINGIETYRYKYSF